MPEPLDNAFSVYPQAGSPSEKFARTDFRTSGTEDATEFETLIETKCPRLAWARASICSCKGFNDQTEQTNPDCPKCNGLGWRYYRPVDYCVDVGRIGALDELQTSILEKANAVVVRGLMVGLAASPDIFNALGKWALGSGTLTMRPRNRVGYYDRIIQLDVVDTFSEVITVDGAGIPTRYPMHSLNFIASVDAEFSNDDVTLFGDGTLRWKTGRMPVVGTRVTLSYMHHPAWVVIEYLNVNRTSLLKLRNPAPQTPQGDTQHLPLRVLVRREHLPMDPTE